MAAGGIGTQLSSPPIQLVNTANAITQKYLAPYLTDSVFLPSPFFWRMTRNGRKLYGGAIVWPVINQEELTGGAYWGSQVLSKAVTDSLQPAELQWRAYQELIAVPLIDSILNTGFAGAVDLVKARTQIAFGSFLMKLQRALQRTSPQNTAIDLDGVPIALAASGTYAGVTINYDPVTGFNWKCNGGQGPQTMAALNTLAGSAAGAALSGIGLQYAYGEASYGNEEPTLVLFTQNGFNAFWGTMFGNQHYDSDLETTRAGFRNLMFNRAVVMHDQFVPSGECQMFTEKYVRVLIHPRRNFAMDDFMLASDQDIALSRIKLIMQLQFLQLRPHTRITSVSNG